MEIINHTNPGAAPVTGDSIEIKDGNSSVKMQHYEAPEETAEHIAKTARGWRDSELVHTDFIVPLSDHPQRAAYMSYRVELRDWPADTDNFPETKPELSEAEL
tara:strand:- start:1471 stop:1779 length:309 start_codon:yes stop_codon:yes gene_type:complete